jgi:hypothetical protein
MLSIGYKNLKISDHAREDIVIDLTGRHCAKIQFKTNFYLEMYYSSNGQTEAAFAYF